MPRHFEAGESGGAKIDEFLRIGAGVSGGYDAGTPDFAYLLVGKAYDEGLCNQRMLVEQFLDFARHHHLAAASVRLLLPPGPCQISVGRYLTDVPGVKPTVCVESRAGLLIFLVVACRHDGTAHVQFAWRPWCQ